MEKLKTIQKRENLNEVYAADEKGKGGEKDPYGGGKGTPVGGVETGGAGPTFEEAGLTSQGPC